MKIRIQMTVKDENGNKNQSKNDNEANKSTIIMKYEWT